jgi:hypothetical protein
MEDVFVKVVVRPPTVAVALRVRSTNDKRLS